MKGSDYLNEVRMLPCCICEKYGLRQTTPTTAHHCIHDRFSQKKRSDFDAIPLCDEHHQGLWRRSKKKIAIHREKRRWRQEYGPDTGYIEQTRRQILGDEHQDYDPDLGYGPWDD